MERPLPTRPAIRPNPDNWEIWIALALGCLAVAGYVIAGWGAPTVYDYYGRLADAFVHGRYWLLDDPAWLNELLSCGDGKWCVAYPPLPAILSIPLLPFGTATAQDLVSQLCGGASAGVLYLALRAYGAPRWVAVTGTLLSAFGTTLLFSSADGRAWYAAHAVAMLFTTIAFQVAARGGPAWWVGVAIGLAALARLPVAAATPALALLVARRGNTSFRAAGTLSASAISGATSSMQLKARLCIPSPKIVIGWPCRIWFMKIPITLR